MKIRKYCPEDLDEILILFQSTIRTVNSKDYTPVQIESWAASALNHEGWSERLLNSETFVADNEGRITGFINIEADGHLDCLFVDALHQGRGVAQALHRAAEEYASRAGIKKLFTEASITARPFFARAGYDLIETQTVWRGEVSFINFRMERILA